MFAHSFKPLFPSLFPSIMLTALAGMIFTLPAAAESHARIVRLSDVQGSVQIDKNAGLGYENAFANLPVIQGSRLHTRENARAEVEFEDGSTLRLTPNTTVLFGTLGVNDAGKRVSVVSLVKGGAYVNWLGSSSDDFTLSFSQEKIAPTHAAHFRVRNSSSLADVASFKNQLEVLGPSSTVRVDKKKMVSFDVNHDDNPTVAKNFERDAYDEWDQQSVEYHDQYAKKNSTPYGYGFSDLNYYGAYNNLPGYGMLWQPYFASAGWDPYMDGAWSYYPGLGFLWASAYPWGWMPYYYGNWTYAPGYGWGWQPGGWNGWRSGIHTVGAVATGFHAPAVPVGTMNTVVVGKGGRAATKAPVSRMVVIRGSAGLGISRGAYGDLHHLSAQVAKANTGSVVLPAAPQFAASSPRLGGFGNAGGTEIHAGGHASGSAAGHASGGSGAHK